MRRSWFRRIGALSLIVSYLFATALLLPFAGIHGIVWRVVSFQVCVPLLTIICLVYVWNFGSVDKTPVCAKGRHFSSLKPGTQYVLRIILKCLGIFVGGIFLLGVVLPLEVKASRLLFLGESEWIVANIISDDSPMKGRFLLERVIVQTPDGQSRTLEYYLPDRRFRIGARQVFELLPGTDIVVNAR
jgi:hypothetical protein